MATDAWCQNNCLAALYFGGACEPQFCACPAGYAGVEVAFVFTEDPRAQGSLAALIEALMAMTGSRAVSIVQILQSTAAGAGTGKFHVLEDEWEVVLKVGPPPKKR